ncbi:MAG: F-type H+-transporting ATPase subunit delta [Candidatus Latescibacterota bacterium]|jgi:F-type H+-transporting ATPase subunit delta
MSTKAGIRYAKAVLQQATENQTAAVVFGDMESIRATLDGSKELRNVLKSPVVKIKDKKEALLSIFKDTSDLSKSLIKILVQNKRVNALGAVALSYINLYNDSQGVKVADVTTAVALSSELEAKVLAKVKELTGSDNVSLRNDIDPNIIGGFILRVGDLQYNASIANQLRSIKREFSKQL